MLMFMWFWTVTAALMPTPAQLVSLQTQAFDTPRAAVEAATRRS